MEPTPEDWQRTGESQSETRGPVAGAHVGLDLTLWEERGYRILGELGRGAMGVVYRAQDLRAGRQVALKVLLGTAQPKRLARLEREGVLSAALSDPGIVQVHDAGEVGGRAYLAFELVPNARTLDDVLPNLSMRERVEALRDVSRALGAAHREGITHRDVKPQNILLGDDGRIRVADFGLATASSLESLTQSGVLLGTPLYMPPEMLIANRDALGPPNDIWALGVMLYEALTDELPFQPASLLELIGLVSLGEFDAPRSLDPEIPSELEAICLKALESAPSDRYPDGDALADDFDSWLAGESVSATPPGWIRRGLNWRRRSPIASAVAIALPLIAILTLVLVRVASPPPAPVAGENVVAEPPPDREPVTAVNDAPAPDPKWLDQGERRWREARQSDDHLRRAIEVEVWLETYAEHPLAPKAEAFLKRDRQRYPRGVVVHTEDEAYATIGCVVDEAFVTVSKGTIKRWSLPGFELERSWVFPEPAEAYSVVARGRGFLAIGGYSVLWSAASVDPGLVELDMTKFDLDPNLGSVGGLRLLPGGDGVLLKSNSGAVIELDLVSKREVRRWSHSGRVRGLAVTPDGECAAASVEGDPVTAIGGSLHLWNLAEGTRTHTTQTHATCSALAFLPDGETLVAGFVDGSILLFDRDANPAGALVGASRNQFGRPTALPARLRGVVPSRDGKTLYALSEDPDASAPGFLSRWSLADRSVLDSARIQTTPYSMTLAEDGSLLVISAFGGRAEVWSAR